jgi:uncharacterized protein (TIGR02996 family)
MRLEKGQGPDRILWEISRKKATVTISLGPYGRAGRTTVREYPDEDRARQVYERAIATKSAEGFVEPPAKAVIGASSKKGVSTKNPELEALIEEDPSDLSRYLIYADWLQQQGDPRGELIIAQHALATGTSTDDLVALDGVEQRLFKMFHAELLGKFASCMHVKARYSSHVRGLAWRCGFLRAARLPWGSGVDAIKHIIGHPSARFLEHLAIPADATAGVCEVLKEGIPSTLKSLALTNVYGSTPLAPLTAVPGIRRLMIGCSLEQLGTNTMESVEELDVAFGSPESLRVLGKTMWPSLKRLHITFSVIDDVDISPALAEILRRMPSAEHISLRRWIAEGDVVLPQDRLAGRILEVFKTERNVVRRLALEMPLSQEGAAALVEPIRALKPLWLHLPKRAVAEASLRSTFLRDLGVIFSDPDPEERDLESIDPYHHAS